MPPSILLPASSLAGGISVEGDQAHYLGRVLRLAPGDAVYLLDGRGSRCRAVIVSIDRRRVLLEPGEIETLDTESALRITLVQGLPKGEKMDWIVQKATELGVAAIAPVITERSQVRHTGGADRWRRIAVSAAAQSGRGVVPEIFEPQTLAGFYRAHDASERGIIFWEGAIVPLADAINGWRRGGGLCALVGPEGGFSADEAGEAVKHGFVPASLGRRILRAETAAVAAVAILQYAMGDV
ncbi:MAG: 16S rRNA (uracil(1498)-N(3))-methyltransferase [Nitrospirae bacterium]|nr:16S rRNA (uracil(1498)-N(3))-methyltransferase [Nitrospirota bacterium]